MEQPNTINSLSIAGTNTAKPMEITQYIVVRLGEEQYGIDIRYIENIARERHYVRVKRK